MSRSLLPGFMASVAGARGARPGVRLVGAIALALATALFSLSFAARTALAADAQVVIFQPTAGDPLSLKYDSATLTVAVGTTVTWVNQGAVAVTVTSADGLFDSETIAPGASFSTTFDTPGTFRYFCVPYPHMKGTVVVKS